MTSFTVGYFVGSLARESINRKLALALIRLAPEELVMREVPFGDLPLYSYDYDADYPLVARQFKEAIAEVDAVLFVTPEYNRSIPGALKNAIDWASRPYGQNSFARKPSATIGASPGKIGTAVGQQHLRSILSFCNSPQMNSIEAYIHFEPGLITDDGEVTNDSTADFLKGYMAELLGFITRVYMAIPPQRVIGGARVIEDLWYKNAVIYSLDVDAFLDGNGDGVGDFEGLIRRMDYLEFLGVDALWLAPFQPSPMRDNGYDVADFYGVDPRYGSSGAFVDFMHQAEKRGIKVLIDLVVNHTSDQHPWFRSARSDPDSPFRDWYIWSKTRPSNWNKGMVFPGVQKSVWTRDEKAGEYYYHRFYEFQPDLNMDNPEVREEILRVIGFWLQLGVHGFRVDAVPFVIESVEPGQEKGKLHFEYLAEIRRFLQWRSGGAILLGEANVKPAENQKYFGEGGDTGIHMMFNFFVNQHLFLALATGEVEPLINALEATRDIPETSQWGQFLRNHDELDLGRLTDDQRQSVFARFAPEARMQLYGRGIRRRLAPMLGDREHEELAYSAMFSMPGSPVIRFGDELRMGDDLELEERNAVRTPMQWADEQNAGFSTARKLPNPVIESGVWGYEHVNVAAQRRDPDSFLNWMAAIIRLRKECPEIGLGEWQTLDAGSDRVLAMLYEWRGNAVLTLHNFGDHPHEAVIELKREDADRLSDLMKEEELHPREANRYRIPLDALDYRWFRVGGLNYAVKRRGARG